MAHSEGIGTAVEFDSVIVGSGAAGTILADRLTECGRTPLPAADLR